MRRPRLCYVNGKLQINKDSLLVDVRDYDGTDPKDEANIKTSRRGRRKKEHSKKWMPDETEKFYRALQIFGTDFTIIAKLLAPRTREQVKVGVPSKA